MEIPDLSEKLWSVYFNFVFSCFDNPDLGSRAVLKFESEPEKPCGIFVFGQKAFSQKSHLNFHSLRQSVFQAI